MTKKVCLVTGVGDGIGAAFDHRRGKGRSGS